MLRTALTWTGIASLLIGLTAFAITDGESKRKDDDGKKQYRLVMKKGGQLIIKDTVVDARMYSPEQFALDNGATTEVKVHEMSSEQATLINHHRAMVLDEHAEMLEGEGKHTVTKVITTDDKGNVNCKMTINGKEVDCDEHAIVMPHHSRGFRHAVHSGHMAPSKAGRHVIVIEDEHADQMVEVLGDSTKKIVIRKSISGAGTEDMDIDIQIDGLDDLDEIIHQSLQGLNLEELLPQIQQKVMMINMDSITDLQFDEDMIIHLERSMELLGDSIELNMEEFEQKMQEFEIKMEEMGGDLEKLLENKLQTMDFEKMIDIKLEGLDSMMHKTLVWTSEDSDEDFAVVIVSPVGKSAEVSSDVQFVDVKIFPNPSSGEVNLELHSTASKKLNVTVRDVTGKKVFTEKVKPYDGHYVKRLDLSDWKSGSYVVEFDTGTETFVERFIVNK